MHSAPIKIPLSSVLFISDIEWASKYTDDDLQNWCSLCIFGSKRTASDAYKSVKEQDKALEEAMVAVGV
jgi:hypothetical protein